jgi:hypothetical protein
MIAIMAIDPGKVTGVARGIFGPGMEAGIKDAVRNAVELETWEVEGPHPVQCWELCAEFQDWVTGLVHSGWCNASEIGERVCLVVEDFRLRTQNVDLDPVLIMGGLTTLLVPRAAGLRGEIGLTGQGGVGMGAYAFGAKVVFQQPADAMRFATAERLREWKVATGSRRGVFGKPISAHRRDAMRHLLFRLGVAMSEAGGAVSVRAAPLGSAANPVVRKGRTRSWAA